MGTQKGKAMTKSKTIDRDTITFLVMITVERARPEDEQLRKGLQELLALSSAELAALRKGIESGLI